MFLYTADTFNPVTVFVDCFSFPALSFAFAYTLYVPLDNSFIKFVSYVVVSFFSFVKMYSTLFIPLLAFVSVSSASSGFAVICIPSSVTCASIEKSCGAFLSIIFISTSFVSSFPSVSVTTYVYFVFSVAVFSSSYVFAPFKFSVFPSGLIILFIPF